MWSWVARRTAVLVTLAACGGSHNETGTRPERTGAVRCASLDDCEHHDRECRVDQRPACETCSAMMPFCVARTPDEIANLDRARQHCEAHAGGAFSYSQGCRCVGTDCPTPAAWCETIGGTFSDELGCIEGELRTGAAHE